MKTYQIKDILKKEIMLIELPENGNTFDDLTFLDSETEGYTILGKPDEIREDDARELVEGTDFKGFNLYWDYINERWFDESMGATESLLSLLESEIFWDVNPLGERNPANNPDFPYLADAQQVIIKRWHEAELRTFDRNRSIILVKN